MHPMQAHAGLLGKMPRGFCRHRSVMVSVRFIAHRVFNRFTDHPAPLTELQVSTARCALTVPNLRTMRVSATRGVGEAPTPLTAATISCYLWQQIHPDFHRVPNRAASLKSHARGRDGYRSAATMCIGITCNAGYVNLVGRHRHMPRALPTQHQQGPIILPRS